jgi:hypothetical protein
MHQGDAHDPGGSTQHGNLFDDRLDVTLSDGLINPLIQHDQNFIIPDLPPS